MHSSINVHFEDYGLAVTDMNTTLDNLNAAGITKVAATGYGSFTQYEELQELIEKKKSKDTNFHVTAYPAITVYFETPDQELTLIAKNKKGYQSLCKIITESNRLGTIIENRVNKSANIPIVSMENLKKNVSKGDLVLTTGGKNGVLFQKIFGQQYKIEKRLEELEQQLQFDFVFDQKTIPMSYEKACAILQQYHTNISANKVTKTELKQAEKDPELYQDLLKDRELYEKAQLYKKAYAPKIDALTKAMKPFEKIYREYHDLKTNLQEVDKIEIAEFVVDLDQIFGEENVYFEIQNHGLEEEKKGYERVLTFLDGYYDGRFIVGNETRIGLTSKATSEEIEKELLKIDVAKFNKQKEYTPREENLQEYNIKTEDELKTLLKDYSFLTEEMIQEMFRNSDKVLDSCTYTSSDEKTNHYPKFCDNEDEEFERLCREGMKERFPNGYSQEYEDRLNYELRVIKNMGYSGYHLIVQDYLKYGKLLGYLSKEDVPNAPWTIEELDQYLTDTKNPRIGMGIGPGRGSAAGSLCCYALGITDLDPIKYGLIFERFLNEERVSMPDIDSDFRPEIRLKCREYVRHKYGFDNTCEIVTKSYMHSKGAIRDTARFLIAKESKDKSPDEILSIKNTYETLASQFSKQIDQYDRLGKIEVDVFTKKLEHDNYPFTENERKLLHMASQIEGTFNGYGQHAAGTIISNCNISDEMPLMWNSSSESLEIQCQNAQSEAKGFLKMDFLGLENLSVITDVEQKSDTKNEFYEIVQNAFKRDEILNDPAIYQHIFSNGLTQGVFQFESPGMKKMLKAFQPECFEDIILLVAAYRPGPISYIPEIIASKWFERDPEHYKEIMSKFYPESSNPKLYQGENGGPVKSISLKNESLQKIVAPTYGCPIYQEQIMQIFQTMAGYSLGRSDEVRRAMSKKKMDKLEHERKNFIFGNAEERKEAKEKGLPIPKEIPGCIALQHITEEEANELFNQMLPFGEYGFNKSHAAAYAVIAAITAWLKEHKTAEFYRSALNVEKITSYEAYIKEFPAMNLKLLPPSLFTKDTEFSIENGNIRYPIAKTKGFAKQDYNYIPSTSLVGFIQRNPNVSIPVLKKLIKIGCFDSCWKMKNPNDQQKEIKRVNHNKETMIEFVTKYYKLIVQYTKCCYDLQNPELTETERQKLEDKQTKIYETIQDGYCKDQEKGQIIKSFETIQNEKKWEYDLLGVTFDRHDELIEQLKTLYKPNENQCFTRILSEKSYDNSITVYNVPFVVLEIGEQKMTKSNKPKKYYPATIMDFKGNIVRTRFSDIPYSQFCIGNVPSNPNFNTEINNNVKTITKIQPSQKQEIHSVNEKLDDFKNGNNFAFQKPDPIQTYAKQINITSDIEEEIDHDDV